MTIWNVRWPRTRELSTLYEDQTVKATRFQTLTQLNQIISASLDMDHVLREIAKAAATLMRAPLVSFRIADETTQTLHLRAVSDAAVGTETMVQTLRFGEGAAGWVAQHRQPLNIPDILVDACYCAGEWAAADDLRSFYGVPVILEGALLAVLPYMAASLSYIGPTMNSCWTAWWPRPRQRFATPLSMRVRPPPATWLRWPTG